MLRKTVWRELRLSALLAGAVGFTAVPAALADQVVYFQNGKAIIVKSVEKGDKLTILEMEGGGKIGVPSAQIVKIEELAVNAPGGVQAPAATGQQAGAPAAQPATITIVTPPPAPAAPASQGASPAQASVVAAPMNRPAGTGFGGTPLAAAQGAAVPAPLPVGAQGQGTPAGQQITPRYPMAPFQGLARGGPAGRMESGVMTGPGGGRQLLPIQMRQGGRGGPEGRMAPLRNLPPPQAPAGTQQQAARPAAPPPPAPPPPSQPSAEAAAADDPAGSNDDADDKEPATPPAPDDGSAEEN